MMLSIALVVFCLHLASAADLPSFIEKCKDTDPDINKCMVKQGNLAIPRVVEGLPKFGIPSLDPFKISEIEILHSSSLRATFRDVEISGLRNSRFIDIGAEFEKGNGYFSIFVDRLDITTEYDVHGQILVLPISGQGHGNMTIYNATFKAATHWEMQHNEKDDMDYFNIVSFKVTYDMDRVYTHLDNLFNGNKELGDNMNRFLNDNWREFAKDVEPAVGDTIGTVIRSVINKLTLKVPVKFWFTH